MLIVFKATFIFNFTSYLFECSAYLQVCMYTIYMLSVREEAEEGGSDPMELELLSAGN